MSDYSQYLSSIEDVIADAKLGKMFILVDDEDRENEGDLIIPAQMADADAINFMAMHGRGLICLALDGERVDGLGLPLMASHNQCRHQTAFTTSIEAREGVTTGISAADRAQTIAVAINPNKNGEDIVSPGHVFPLRAKDGGVLVRAGHTEAAVDISRLAGLNPSGVICEIMNDDGTMSRLPELIEFAQKHDMKIATIAALIAWRRQKETLVKKTMTAPFVSEAGGEFTLYCYTTTLEYAEHVVLVKGDISGNEPVLVRMHAMDVLTDVLGDVRSGKGGELHRAMQKIEEHGSGVLVLLREPRRDSLSHSMQKYLADNDNAAHITRLRDYGIGAQILRDLEVQDMVLLTNSDPNVIAIEGYGLRIVGCQPL